jgi:hypothetical protein
MEAENSDNEQELKKSEVAMPESLAKAVLLIWVSVGISFASIIHLMLETPSVMPNRGAAIISFVITFIVFATVIVLLKKRKGWVRIPYLVLTLLSLANFLYHLITSPIEIFLSVGGLEALINHFLPLVILYYLYCEQTANWFKGLADVETNAP